MSNHGLDRVLQLKPHLRLEPLDGERIFLLGEGEQFLLKWRLYALVAPLVDGRRTVAQILQALEGQASPPEVFYALSVLEERGYLVEVAPELAPEAAAFWQSLGIPPRRAAERLAATPVAVEAMGEVEAQPLVEALRGAGVEVRSEAALHVVVTEDYLAPGLEGRNRRALEQRTRWVPVKPTGAMAWVGPVFRPGAGPCWACLAHRLRGNRPVELFLERHKGQAVPLTPPRAGLPASLQAGVHFAALTLARWIIEGCQGQIEDRLLTLELSRFATQEHEVVRRPQCPACGQPELARERVLAPVRLESRPKRFTGDGGHRSAAPEETLARFSRHVSPITGIITSLGPLVGRDHPLRPVYGASYRVCPASSAPSFEDFQRASLGKGCTPAQSRASALCEAIERHSALFQGDEPRIRASLAELGGEAVHPDALQNYSEAQLRSREAVNARTADDRRRIPLPFDPHATIDWTPVWSLTGSRRRWVPTAYCYAHLPVPEQERFCYMNSNGHAAGNCLEEAILQGFLELAERDAVAIWWYNRLRRPRVELSSFGEPYFQTLEEHYHGLGYRVWVLDLTHDLGLPTFAALARSTETGRYCIGFGCHSEARLGVQRALTELNQLFDPAPGAASPWDPRALGEDSFLLPDEAVPARVRGDFQEPRSEDLKEDVLACVERAARAGLEVLVLDQTRLDVGLCAVKVMVPGLRHFWPRLGPGRLYEVPVALGWRQRPLTEEQLNPVSLYS